MLDKIKEWLLGQGTSIKDFIGNFLSTITERVGINSFWGKIQGYFGQFSEMLSGLGINYFDQKVTDLLPEEVVTAMQDDPQIKEENSNPLQNINDAEDKTIKILSGYAASLLEVDSELAQKISDFTQRVNLAFTAGADIEGGLDIADENLFEHGYTALKSKFASVAADNKEELAGTLRNIFNNTDMDDIQKIMEVRAVYEATNDPATPKI